MTVNICKHVHRHRIRPFMATLCVRPWHWRHSWKPIECARGTSRSRLIHVFLSISYFRSSYTLLVIQTGHSGKMEWVLSSNIWAWSYTWAIVYFRVLTVRCSIAIHFTTAVNGAQKLSSVSPQFSSFNGKLQLVRSSQPILRILPIHLVPIGIPYPPAKVHGVWHFRAESVVWGQPFCILLQHLRLCSSIVLSSKHIQTSLGQRNPKEVSVIIIHYPPFQNQLHKISFSDSPGQKTTAHRLEYHNT